MSFSIISSVPARGGIGVLRLVGELDLCGADQVRSAVRGWTSSTSSSRPCRAVVLDLSRLTFIDGTGARALASAHSEASVEGVDVALAAPTATVARYLRITRAASGLPCLPSVAQAVSRYRRRAEGRAAEAARSA